MNGRLIATTDDTEATDWQYIGPNPVSTCGSTLFNSFNQKIRSGNEVVLETLDYGHYYCFRVLSSDAEYIYKTHLVLYDGRLIEISQDSNSQNEIVLSATHQKEVLSWQHSVQLSDDVCSAEIFADPTQFAAGNSLVIDRLDLSDADSEPTNVYYCFRAEVEAGSWVYKNHLLQFTEPPFVWKIETDYLLIEVDGLSAANGEYVVQDVDEGSCSLEAFVNRDEVKRGNLILINEETPAAYCFRIKDELKVYHYNRYVLGDS